MSVAVATATGRSGSWVGDRGCEILRVLAIDDRSDPGPLAERIVAGAGAGSFETPLRSGLAILLAAVHRRSAPLATAAACRLVGVGPGRTPLGDDFLAASALTVAVLGSEVGFADEPRLEWLAAALPRRLIEITTDVSAELLFAACRGIPPEPVARVLEQDLDRDGLRMAIERVSDVGATSGRGWAAGIGATAMLLAEVSPILANEPQGDAYK